MKRDKYRRLPRTLGVGSQKSESRRARPPTRSVARATPDIQRYSYQMSLRKLALKMRAMSGRLRRVETQLSRGYTTLSGTKEEMDNADNVGGGLLWWTTDESVLYVYDDTGWRLSKATHSGTTVERLAYIPVFTGETWWDTTLEQLFVWNGSAWDDVAVVHSGTTVEKDAYSQDTGDLWWDTTEREWYSDIGDGWQTMNPSLLDSIIRLPGVRYVSAPNGLWGGQPDTATAAGYVNITPYASANKNFNIGESMSDNELVLCVWANPRYTSSSAPENGILIHQRQWWLPDDSFSFSLEQPEDRFVFGISTDGLKANWIYVDTSPVANITDGWHFLVAIYDPGVSMRLFHNGTWYEYGGVVPASRYIDQTSAYLVGQYSYWAVFANSIVIPSNDIVEHIYDRTRGLFT